MKTDHVPHRLRFARERAGLTQADVREKAGIGESSLSEFENGKREPTLSQLSSLAAAYRRDVSFFLSTEALPTEVVRWREKPEGAERVEATFRQLCEHYHNLEMWCDARVACALPSVPTPERGFNRGVVETLAVRVRRELDLGSRPGPGLLHAVEERCGLKVFHLDFEPSGAAACTKSPSFGAAVLLNKKNPKWRRNYDLAHELFHLLTWDFAGSDDAPNSHTWAESEEKLADSFAAGLLMPADALREAVGTRLRDGKLPLAALFEIAREFDVSVETLVWRIHVLYGGTPAEKDRAKGMIQRAREAASLFENRTQEVPPERPARFLSLALAALRAGEISVGRFAEYVGTTRQRAMQVVEQELGDDEGLELPAP